MHTDAKMLSLQIWCTVYFMFQACFTHSANFISRCEHFPRNKGLPFAPMAESIWTHKERQQLAQLMEKAERHGQSLAVFSGPEATSFCDDASDFSVVTDM